MEGLISEIRNIPHFGGHSEAFQWFKDKFNDSLIYKGSGTYEGEQIYFYHLIMDQDNYKEGIENIEKSGLTSGFELTMSYHIVLILEYGRTQVIF